METLVPINHDFSRNPQLQSKDALIWLDKRGFFDCNLSALQLFGCSDKQSIYGKSLSDFSPLFQPNKQGSASTFQTYVFKALTKGNCCFEWLCNRLDRSEFWADVVLTAIDRNYQRVLQITIRDRNGIKPRRSSVVQPEPEMPLPEPKPSLIADVPEPEETTEASLIVQLGAALESASDAISITDRSGTATYVNKAFVELFGYTLPELQNSDVLNSLFLNPKVAEVIFKVVSQGGTWRDELDMCNRQGQIIPIALRVDGIKNQIEEVVGLVGIYTDISDRKQAEAEIDRTLSILATTLESTADGILVVDRQGKSVICNQKFVEIWRFPPSISVSQDDDKMLAFMLTQLQAPELFLHKTREIATQLNSESYDILQFRDSRIVESFSQPQKVAGEIVGRVWSFRDITKRVDDEAALRSSESKFREQAEELAEALLELQQTQSQLIQHEKMSSLGQLVAGIAHEINNPVNFIYGNLAYANRYVQDLLGLLKLYHHHYPEPAKEIIEESEAIELEFLAEDLPKLINSMKVGSDRIQKIVLSLRNFSRMDEAEYKAVDIHDGIDSTLMILQNRLKARPDRVEINIVKEYGKLPLVECYAGQLNQVFMNILGNAIDALDEAIASQQLSLFSPTQAISMIQDEQNLQPQNLTPNSVSQNSLSPFIWIATTVSDENYVLIQIADNGSGIPELLQQKLFDPFFTTKPVGKGTGLGLSISYQIVKEKHGGNLECISETGQGTKFLIKIPITQSKILI